MAQHKIYPGIENDHWGGMTDIGKIIRDAWVFELLPEDQTCDGWDYSRIEMLYDQVHKAWEPYGHLVSQLPSELRERHERIHGEAIRRARELGWDPCLDDES
jgi:hypothetical protein